MSKEIIKVSGLVKTYHGSGHRTDVHALRGVDLSLNSGEFIALRGPSGCGKTSLLMAIGGLMQPDKGEISINGKNPYALSTAQRALFRADNMGFVFQSFYLIPYLTVMENVMVCRLTRRKKLDLETTASLLLEKLGLSNRKNHLPSELSIGEQQRTALARAMCGGASIILADEPTGNLDTENGAIVLKHLADFAKNGGCVLMVTHDQLAADYTFRYIDMKDGLLLDQL